MQHHPSRSRWQRARPALALALPLLLLATPSARASHDPCDGNCPDGRPQIMTLRYTGEDCSATNHHQDPAKVSCAGDPAMAPTVHAIVSDKADLTDSHTTIWYEGDVALGDTFDVDSTLAGAQHFGARTFVTLFDVGSGAELQAIEFHTSCSQPLVIGDQFGSIVLEGFVGENAGTSDNGSCCTGGKPRLLAMRYTGEDCSATHHNQDPTKVSCSGDPLFAPEVFITASDKADYHASNAKIWFQGVVTLGETFHVNAASEGLTRLSSETWIHVEGLDGSGLQVVKFHTSCSQPLFHGDQFGSLRLEACLSECSDDPAVPYCFADQGDCPCGLDYPGGGCPNTSGVGGVLEATGTSSVASDDLRFHAYQLLPSQFGLYFMGRAQIRGLFGGGLRCVGAGGLKIFRFPVQPISADGTLDLGPGIAQYTLDHFLPTGHILVGDSWNFQVWYRDPTTTCSAKFNLTNGVSITFTP